jgi:histidinol-phosphate aminotransferase
MITRRAFLRFGTSAVAAAALPFSISAASDVGVESAGHEHSAFIRLDRNENPYGPSPSVAAAAKSTLDLVSRYPRTARDTLSERIALLSHVEPEQVLLGCGSTELLRAAANAFLGKGKQLVQASPTFEAMEHYASAAGAEVVSVPLTATFAHDLNGMLVRTGDSTGLVYICNPNNPTASLTARKDLETFLSRLRGSTVVLIDEAYHHYAGSSGMYASFIDQPLADERVIVTRTFSAVYGLAGLRLGYAVGSPKIVGQMTRFTTLDNINAVAAHAAVTSLGDVNAVNNFIQRNANDRQEFFNQAMARALKPVDSHANFVMMNTMHPAKDVAGFFRTKGVLIAAGFPRMDTYIRVSLGRPEEMRIFWQTWDTLPYPKNVMSH